MFSIFFSPRSKRFLQSLSWPRMAAAWALLGMALSACASPLPAEVAAELARHGIPANSVSMVVRPIDGPRDNMQDFLQQLGNGSAQALGRPSASARPLSAKNLNWQEHKAMNPASVMKLVTTYAGLDMLGPSHFWKTRVFAQGQVIDGSLHGDLIVRGSGDPKLDYLRLQDLMQAVHHQGIHDIRGNILLDNHVFSLPPHDPAAFDGEPLKPYNAGPDGLLVNFKALIFKFMPDPRAGVAYIETEPPMSGVSIPQSVPLVKGACGNWKNRLHADFDNPVDIRFSGAYPSSCGKKVWNTAYMDPANFAPRVIEALWRESGGSLAGQAQWMSGADAGRIVATAYSLPLMEIITDINKFSNNVMAQQLFLSLSASEDHSGSFQASRQRVNSWWKQHFGQLEAPLIENGSGLSRNERVSAAGLAALLEEAAQSPYALVFEQSLPIAGVDGTAKGLGWRSPHSPAIGNASFKTGTLRNVTAIAGYAWGHSGQRYVVIGMINHENAKAARSALDRLVEWAVEDQQLLAQQ